MVEYRKSSVSNKVLVGSDGLLRDAASGKLLNTTKHTKGYLQVSIEGKNYLVHRLVALAFPDICGEFFENSQVDHINTIRSDNRAENLRVVSVSENHLNPITRNRMSESHKGNKSANRRKVISTGYVMDIFLYEYESISEAARQMGSINYICGIRRCCNGLGNHCAGRRWKYADN